MANQAPNENPLPLIFIEDGFEPPFKFVLDPGFISRLELHGIEDPVAFISQFMNASVQLIKTKCLSSVLSFDVKDHTCVHGGLLDSYIQCITKLIGSYNPHNYIFATTPINSHIFDQVPNVPVLVLDEDGVLFFRPPTAVQVEFVNHGDVQLLMDEKNRMKNKISHLKFCERQRI